MMEQFEQVYFPPPTGMGIIAKEKVYFENKDLVIFDSIIKQTEKTDLFDFFSEPIEYCGFYKDFHVFYLGETSNLFEIKYYYECLTVLKDNRIFKKYGDHGGGFGRDFSLKNGIWK